MKIRKCISKLTHHIKNDELAMLDKLNIKIERNPELLRKYNVFVTGFGTTVNGEKVIYTDNIFDQLTENTKKFILWHEIGHQMLNLDNTNLLIQAKAWELYFTEESKCDKYALTRLGINSVLESFTELIVKTAPIELSIAINFAIRAQIIGADISQIKFMTKNGQMITSKDFMNAFTGKLAIS